MCVCALLIMYEFHPPMWLSPNVDQQLWSLFEGHEHLNFLALLT